MAEQDLVERKIHFYLANAGQEEFGSLLPFDPDPVLERIDAIPKNSPQRRLQRADNKSTYCWVDRRDAPQRIRVATIRRSGYPFVERLGDLSPLGVPEDSGLADPIHVVFFDNNVVGADYNFYGPRLGSLEHYFRSKADGTCPRELRFETLMDPDAAERLERFRELRVLDLKVRPSDAEVRSQLSEGLGGGFDASDAMGSVGEVGILLKPEPYSRESIPRRILDFARRMSRNENFLNNSNRFRAKGVDESGDVEVVDILNDQLVVNKKMIREDPQSRALVKESVYAAIEESYEELENKIERAVSIYASRPNDPA